MKPANVTDLECFADLYCFAVLEQTARLPYYNSYAGKLIIFPKLKNGVLYIPNVMRETNYIPKVEVW